MKIMISFKPNADNRVLTKQKKNRSRVCGTQVYLTIWYISTKWAIWTSLYSDFILIFCIFTVLSSCMIYIREQFIINSSVMQERKWCTKLSLNTNQQSNKLNSHHRQKRFRILWEFLQTEGETKQFFKHLQDNFWAQASKKNIPAPVNINKLQCRFLLHLPVVFGCVQ